MDNIQNNEEIKQIDSKNLEKAIEAILFAAGHPVTYAKLAEVLGYFEATIKKKVIAFAEKYNDNERRGIMLLAFENSCQLCTREEYKDYVRQTLGIKMSGKISASSLEVLAIVAYNQPVTKAFIEQVRGVDCSYAISSLSDKGLIEAKDRLDVPGRPLLYSTTEAFLRCFGINDLGELPKVDFKDDDGEKSVDGEQVELVI